MLGVEVYYYFQKYVSERDEDRSLSKDLLVDTGKTNDLVPFAYASARSTVSRQGCIDCRW